MYLALTVSITLYSYMAHSPALNGEAISSCETLLSLYKTTWCPTSDVSNFMVQTLFGKQALKGDKLQ
jgi:hypothetical protein